MTIDRSVVERAQRGERPALELFFEYHLPLLRSWTARRVPQWLESSADADDLVQQAAMKTLRQLHRLTPERSASIQAYMRQIVVNLVRDEARKSGRSPDHIPLEDEHAAGGASALDAIIGHELWITYADAMRTLSARDRKAVTGRLERGLSYELLKDVLKVRTANAARVAVSRALVRLVKAMCLQPEAPTDAACRDQAPRDGRARKGDR
jgi:RNA polymerase sigma factor (sigma-70 family)